MSAVRKWGGRTLDYAKCGGQEPKFMGSISDFGQNSAKVGGSCTPCPPVDKCPVITFMFDLAILNHFGFSVTNVHIKSLSRISFYLLKNLHKKKFMRNLDQVRKDLHK